ncbi:MAG: hypothetical protein QNJ98_11175 [Planctomycetota bacterium]|nr:hypothetical protein [Planctomycetota bacterium]
MPRPRSAPRSPTWIAVLMLGALALMGLASTPTAHAGESVDVQDVSSETASAVSKYRSKSKACLDKLVGIIKGGANRSTDKWQSVCKDAEGALLTLVKESEVSTRLGNWVIQEVEAWSRMASIGTRICYMNELLLTYADRLDMCTDITEDEIKTVTADIKSMIEAAMEQLGKEARDVVGYLETLDEEAEGLGLIDDDTRGRNVIAALAGLDDSLEDVEEFAGKAASLEGHLRRLGDSIRRRKSAYLKVSEKRLAQYRRDLASLVSAKIDPDGSGVFVRYETRIEEIAQDNLDRYATSLKKWEAANKTFLGNARDFAIAYVDKAVATVGKAVPQVAAGHQLVKVVKKGGSFLDAIEPFIESLKTTVDRVTGAKWKKIKAATSNMKEQLNDLREEQRRKVQELQRANTEKIDDMKEASEKETRRFQDEIAAQKRRLSQLAEDDDKNRRDAEGNIEDRTRQLELEARSLARRIQREKGRLARTLSAVGKRYAKRINRLEERIKETEAIGGEIK